MTEVIRIDDTKVRRLFQVLPEAMGRRLNTLIEAAAIDTQREMRINAPVAVTGQLRGSARYKVDRTRFSAEIAPEVPYARFVEEGTKPHRVSVAPGTPLYRWAIFKGISPFAVAGSIAKKGTKANPFVAKTYRTMRPRVERDVVSGMARFIQEADRGTV